MTLKEILTKRKRIMLLLVGLIVWFCYSPTPTIRFIEFRESQSIPTGSGIPRVGRGAVFRITNDSRHPYSFFANAPSWPFGIFKSADPSDKSGWSTWAPRRWGRVADTIAPHSTADVLVHVNASDVQMKGDFTPADFAAQLARADLAVLVPLESQQPFALGIHFERGTAAELESRNGSRSSVSWFFYRLRLRIDPDYRTEPTWSTVASAPRLSHYRAFGPAEDS